MRRVRVAEVRHFRRCLPGLARFRVRERARAITRTWGGRDPRRDPRARARREWASCAYSQDHVPCAEARATEREGVDSSYHQQQRPEAPRSRTAKQGHVCRKSSILLSRSSTARRNGTSGTGTRRARTAERAVDGSCSSVIASRAGTPDPSPATQRSRGKSGGFCIAALFPSPTGCPRGRSCRSPSLRPPRRRHRRRPALG